MKDKNINQLSEKELLKEIQDSQGELLNLRLRKQTLEKPHKIRQLRRQIARLKTALRSKELATS